AERHAFLSECLRVARHGAVFTCPHDAAEVREAEAWAAESFLRRHGYPHPFLQEHVEFGIPREEDILAWLREFDYPHAVFDNGPLDEWLAMLLLSENLAERSADLDLQRQVNQQCLRHSRPAAPLCYRKIYVCAKTFDASAGLDPG